MSETIGPSLKDIVNVDGWPTEETLRIVFRVAGLKVPSSFDNTYGYEPPARPPVIKAVKVVNGVFEVRKPEVHEETILYISRAE